METRVPPPILLLALAAVVWALPGSTYSLVRIAIGVPLVVLGLSLDAWPKTLFRHVGTTVNSLHPERSSVLVTPGLYRYSRNPMYVGYAMAPLDWGVCQGLPLGVVAVAFSVGDVTIFQILPEERHLSARFPAEYAAYKRAVRRWG
ncbi:MULTISPECIES: isoprenylcysteine carboxylmethyltransferase family protein [unclassified Stenotrophomonas]|uniref:methyltransferase family protein n=1 Tax=unclassified Stenotrophomonas TaxID=196198 RepID=UPI00211796CE|nr:MULTISPECIES: isoprenylcysteine carboxylmethyltransferase family protein [unclassified Stenotrophomonas]